MKAKPPAQHPLHCSLSELRLASGPEVSQDGGWRHLAKSSLQLHGVSLSCVLLQGDFSTHVCPHPSFQENNAQLNHCSAFLQTWRNSGRDARHGAERLLAAGAEGAGRDEELVATPARLRKTERLGWNLAHGRSCGTAASDYCPFSHSACQCNTGH